MKTCCYDLYDINFTLHISFKKLFCLKPVPHKSDNFKNFYIKSVI
jgi:hypothetical protein